MLLQIWQIEQLLVGSLGQPVYYRDTRGRLHCGWLGRAPEREFTFTSPDFEDVFGAAAVQGIEVGKHFPTITRRPIEKVCTYERVKTADDYLRSSWNFDRLSLPLYDIHQDSKKWRKGAR